MENKILRIIYTFFLGIMLALFVGLGISTFYEAPKAPEYTSPAYPASSKEADAGSARDYNNQYKEFNQQNITYNRNVSMIALGAAVIMLATSFILEKRNRVIANGVLLGAVFTLLYSVGRGFASQDSKYTFVAVSIGLVIALYLGYRRFSDQSKTKKG